MTFDILVKPNQGSIKSHSDDVPVNFQLTRNSLLKSLPGLCLRLIAVLSLGDHKWEVVLQRLHPSCELPIGGAHNHVVLGRSLRVQDLKQYRLVPALFCALAPAHIIPQVTLQGLTPVADTPCNYSAQKPISQTFAMHPLNLPRVGACLTMVLVKHISKLAGSRRVHRTMTAAWIQSRNQAMRGHAQKNASILLRCSAPIELHIRCEYLNCCPPAP